MRSIAVLILAVASLAHTAEASACSCMKLTPAEGLTSSFAVFTGEVTAINKNQTTRFGGLEVTLRVEKMWKGEPAKELKVHTAGSSAACGYPFTLGTTYLIYAVRDEADPMRVSLCSRTAPVDRAKEDLDYLGKPKHQIDASRRGSGRCSASQGPSDDAPAAWFAIIITVAATSFGIRRIV